MTAILRTERKTGDQYQLYKPWMEPAKGMRARRTLRPPITRTGSTGAKQQSKSTDVFLRRERLHGAHGGAKNNGAIAL